MGSICIIVPVYNAEKYLKRCVDSIILQTYSDYELLLIDDGSTDLSPLICDELAKKDLRIHVYHQSNKGVSAARNFGIDWAFDHPTCEWITVIDSDDWVHPCYLETLYDAAISCCVPISHCNCQRVSEKKSPEEVMSFEVGIVSPEDIFLNKSGCGADGYSWGFLFRKELFTDVRYPEGRIYEDLAIMPLILFQTDKTAAVNSGLYYYYYLPTSLSHSKWTIRQMDSIMAYEDNLEFFNNGKLGEKYYNIVYGYLESIHTQYEKMLESESNLASKRKYKKILKRKMRKALKKYAREWNFTVSDFSWLYAVPFPTAIKCYWLIKRWLHF